MLHCCFGAAASSSSPLLHCSATALVLRRSCCLQPTHSCPAACCSSLPTSHRTSHRTPVSLLRPAAPRTGVTLLQPTELLGRHRKLAIPLRQCSHRKCRCPGAARPAAAGPPHHIRRRLELPWSAVSLLPPRAPASSVFCRSRLELRRPAVHAAASRSHGGPSLPAATASRFRSWPSPPLLPRGHLPRDGEEQGTNVQAPPARALWSISHALCPVRQENEFLSVHPPKSKSGMRLPTNLRFGVCPRKKN